MVVIQLVYEDNPNHEGDDGRNLVTDGRFVETLDKNFIVGGDISEQHASRRFVHER